MREVRPKARWAERAATVQGPSDVLTWWRSDVVPRLREAVGLAERLEVALDEIDGQTMWPAARRILGPTRMLRRQLERLRGAAAGGIDAVDCPACAGLDMRCQLCGGHGLVSGLAALGYVRHGR